MTETAPAGTERSLWRALGRGWRRRCPRCGEDRLFEGYLKVRTGCRACGLDYSGHRADDLPPYLTIFIVAKVTAPLVLLMERMAEPSMTFSMVFWSFFVAAFALFLLPRVKGAVIGLQWAYGMHGFGDGDGWAERPAPGVDDDESGVLRRGGS